MIYGDRDYAIAFNLLGLIRFYYGKLNCWVPLRLFQILSSNLTIQQVSSKSIIYRLRGVDIDSSTPELKILGNTRDIFNMVIVLMSKQNCLKFLLSWKG
ncbi:hypothetical protein ES703_120799 [subsurface metagenome]